MNKGKRKQAIELLTGLNKNYQEQINISSDKAFKDAMILKIHHNERYIKILESNEWDYTNVKKISDLDNLKKKPNEWD